MAVVQLSQFDITVGQLYHFATGGFWANLPRFCRNVPAARLLLVSDTLNPQHIQDGFTAAAQSEDGLPPSLRAFRMQYEDYLGQMSREVRFMRVYLVMESYLSDDSLCQMLSTYNIPARPLTEAVPRPFARGVDKWDHVLADDGTYWRLLRSKTIQHGSIFARVFHRLFGLEFPVFAALNIYTFPPAEANDILRRKSMAVRYSRPQGDAVAEMQSLAGSIGSMQAEMSRFGTAFHTVRLHVLVSGDSPARLRERTDIVRGALAGVGMDSVQPQGPELSAVFSAKSMPSSDGSTLTTPGVALMAGSALSYRRRTETRGVLLGTDQNQAPVVFNFFDDNASSYNSVVLGQSGKGKTFAVLLIMLRHMLLGVRNIIIDPQGNIDLAFLGDEHSYHLSRLGTDKASINIMDITRDEMMTQISSVKHILQMLNVLPPGDATAEAVTDQVLMDIYRPLWDYRDKLPLAQMPTLKAVQSRLTDIAQSGSQTATSAARSSAQQIAYQLDPYVVGSLATLFGQATTVDFSLQRDMTVYDVSRLPDSATGGNLRAVLLAILVADINQHIRRLRRGDAGRERDTTPILFFVDEMGVLMRDAVIASYVSAEYKTARARRVGMIVADQDLHSLLGPADHTGLHHGEPILANAAYRFLFMQPDDQLAILRDKFPGLPRALVNRLPGLPRGTCIAQFPDDLLVVNVDASPLEEIVLSSRLEDQASARDLVKRMMAESGKPLAAPNGANGARR